jgi:hypothetical protein
MLGLAVLVQVSPCPISSIPQLKCRKRLKLLNWVIYGSVRLFKLRL